jgi:hypothetical protein
MQVLPGDRRSSSRETFYKKTGRSATLEQAGLSSVLPRVIILGHKELLKETTMLKKSILALSLAILLALPILASPPKTYQVTGPVLELTADTIVVKKGSDRWEIARDASTKVTGDLKVGATVTIQYRMSAASIDVKADKAAAKKSPKKGS